MLKRAPYLFLLIFFALWQRSGAQQAGGTGQVSRSDSASVIYEARGRVYIDKGTLDGIDEAWRVAVPNPYGQPIYLPLSWIGDDVACFSKPESLYYYFQAGEILTLHKSQDQHSPGYKITLAYPHAPAMPHEGAVDHYDREFQALLSPHLQIRPLKTSEHRSTNDPAQKNSDSPGDEDEIYGFYCAEEGYCDSSRAGIADAYYTLQYYKNNPIPEAYGIKYLPPLDDPLYIYWDTVLNVCIPAQAAEKRFEEIFNSARFSILKPFPGIPEDSRSGIPGNFEQTSDSPAFYGSTYGPYFISEDDNDQITLLRNEGCQTSQALPDTIIIRIEPDYLKRKLMFQLGEIDFLDLHFSDVEQFESDYKVKQAELDEAAYLSVNNIKPFLSDGIMATALSYLVNKDGLCRVALGGSAVPLNNLISKWNREVQPMYEYDKNKGQSLIKNMSAVSRYLSLYISPNDFLNRRTAEYIKGILERRNIYVTIYSEMQTGEGRSYDLFQQFDMMIGRIDLSLDDPAYILNQTAFHYDLQDITRNRSLYYSENVDSVMNQHLQGPDAGENILKEYYRSLIEFPAGLPLYCPIRQVAASDRIKSFDLTKEGLIDFSSIEIKDETER